MFLTFESPSIHPSFLPLSSCLFHSLLSKTFREKLELLDWNVIQSRTECLMGKGTNILFCFYFLPFIHFKIYKYQAPTVC